MLVSGGTVLQVYPLNKYAVGIFLTMGILKPSPLTKISQYSELTSSPAELRVIVTDLYLASATF